MPACLQLALFLFPKVHLSTKARNHQILPKNHTLQSLPLKGNTIHVPSLFLLVINSAPISATLTNYHVPLQLQPLDDLSRVTKSSFVTSHYLDEPDAGPGLNS